MLLVSPHGHHNQQGLVLGQVAMYVLIRKKIAVGPYKTTVLCVIFQIVQQFLAIMKVEMHTYVWKGKFLDQITTLRPPQGVHSDD